MKKMELSFQAAISDVFFSIGEKRLFCYEQDKEELVNLYGGKNYYISQSGLSGAGFLDFSNRENDLIRLGWYRTDTKQTNEMGSEKISGIEVYVPLNGHNGIADQDPMILVRDNKIGFVQIYDFKGMVTDLVSGFNSLFEIDYKHFETEMFNEIGGKFPFTWELSNICQFRGINCLNFLRLPEIYRQPTADRIRGDFPFTLGKLNIVKFNDENEKPFFLHRMNAIGGEYYDNILHPDDLINPEPTEIAQGFKYDASGFYYRRQYSEILGDECVYAFMEIETPDRYFTKEDENEFCEYELEVPLIEFYTTERSVIAEKLKLRIAKKARNNWLVHEKWTRENKILIELETIIASSPDIVVELRDSITAGNCEYGSRSFAEKYNLSEGVTFGELLQHKNWEEIFRNKWFKNTLVTSIERHNLS